MKHHIPLSFALKWVSHNAGQDEYSEQGSERSIGLWAATIILRVNIQFVEMIDRCFNAACGKRLHYLRDGRVVRQARKISSSEHIEHFWLCGDCSAVYKFCWLGDERPTLAEKTLKENQAGRRLEIFS